MKCFHLQIGKGVNMETVHVNVDTIEMLTSKGDGTRVVLCSGKVLETELDLETVLKRIDEAPSRHVTNGG